MSVRMISREEMQQLQAQPGFEGKLWRLTGMFDPDAIARWIHLERLRGRRKLGESLAPEEAVEAVATVYAAGALVLAGAVGQEDRRGLIFGEQGLLGRLTPKIERHL